MTGWNWNNGRNNNWSNNAGKGWNGNSKKNKKKNDKHWSDRADRPYVTCTECGFWCYADTNKLVCPRKSCGKPLPFDCFNDADQGQQEIPDKQAQVLRTMQSFIAQVADKEDGQFAELHRVITGMLETGKPPKQEEFPSEEQARANETKAWMESRGRCLAAENAMQKYDKQHIALLRRLDAAKQTVKDIEEEVEQNTNNLKEARAEHAEAHTERDSLTIPATFAKQRFTASTPGQSSQSPGSQWDVMGEFASAASRYVNKENDGAPAQQHQHLQHPPVAEAVDTEMEVDPEAAEGELQRA